MNTKRKNEAIEWAREVLAHPGEYVIFDTETTGLKESDVIIHLAIMDLSGKMLVDTKVKPRSKRRMSQDAEDIHGITMSDLKAAPGFEEVLEIVRPVVEGKKVLSYRAEFHVRMFDQSFENEVVSGEYVWLDWDDVQSRYEAFVGRDYAPLPGRDNTGEGDCRATLAVIQKMAVSPLEDIRGEVAPQVEIAAARRYHDRSKSAAGLLALLLGGLGAHRFYLGQTGMGVLYLVFCWTFIPAFIGLIDAISLFSMSLEHFDKKYNYRP